VITEEEIKTAQLFYVLTGIEPLYVIPFEQGDKPGVLITVECGLAAPAVGRNGAFVKAIARATGKVVIVVEKCDPAYTAKWLFRLANVLDVRVEGNKVVVEVPPQDLGVAIGRNSWRLNLAKRLFRDLYDLDVEIRPRLAEK